MAQHVKVLGILHIAMGALSVLAGLGLLGLFGGLAGLASWRGEDLLAVPILGGIGGLIFVVLTLLGLPGIIAGWGLLNFRPWARILTIILSAFDLFHMPFGTALGVYGFWVLLSREGEQLFAAYGTPRAQWTRPT